MATASMTNALFSVMDRRGDGVLHRDEFNEMAFMAIHNNPLVKRPPGGHPGGFPPPAPVPAPAPPLAPLSGHLPAEVVRWPSFAPASGAPPAPAAAFGGAVTFGGMTFSAPPAGAPLPPPAAPGPSPASAAWTPSGAPALVGSVALPAASAPPPTQSAFLAAPALPGVTATAPTKSMTNALFTAMDRRGDGVLTRDEWNQMAVTAVHNNPLVRPSKSLSATVSSGQSFALASPAPSFAAPAQSFGAQVPPGGPTFARAASSAPGISPAPSHAAAQSFGLAALGEVPGLCARPSMAFAPAGHAPGAWC